MFHDDDALINLEKAIKFFDGPTAKEMNCFGFLGENSRPHRWGKYNVTELQWESGTFQVAKDRPLSFSGHSTDSIVDISPDVMSWTIQFYSKDRPVSTL